MIRMLRYTLTIPMRLALFMLMLPILLGMCLTDELEAVRDEVVRLWTCSPVELLAEGD